MNIADLRELIQDDLIALLDGLSEEITIDDDFYKDKACQIVVDRIKEYEIFKHIL